MRIAFLMLLPSLALAKPTPDDQRKSGPAGGSGPEAAAYQKELEAKGLIDKSVATPERLAKEVRAADDE
jgi:hypothetical protein